LSENQDEKMRKLREEVNMLKKQLIRISEELEPIEESSEEEPVEIKIEKSQEPEAPESEPEAEPEQVEAHEYSNREDRRNSRNERYGRLYGEMYGRAWRPGEPFGERLGEYISAFVNDILENVTSEVENTVFVQDKMRRDRPTTLSREDIRQIANVMSALGNEHRIKILEELSWGGMYASDFQESLKDISPSTLSSHLDVLQEAGLVVQEKSRGRYLISMKGRLAINTASSLAKQNTESYERGRE